MGIRANTKVKSRVMASGVALACLITAAAALPLLANRQRAAIQVDAARIRAHVKYLASDELQGRGMGQKGSDLAADYIGKQLESYGLKPAGDSGTYFQSVPMVGVKTLPQTTFEVQRDGETLSLKNQGDCI